VQKTASARVIAYLPRLTWNACRRRPAALYSKGAIDPDNREETNMTQRLRGISDAEATGAAKEIFESSDKLLGRTANLMRILAHSPHLTKWYLGFVAAVRQPDAGAISDVRLRNLAVLKTSTLNGCNY